MIFYGRKLLSRDNFESILLLLVVFIKHRHSIVLVLPQQKKEGISALQTIYYLLYKSILSRDS